MVSILSYPGIPVADGGESGPFSSLPEDAQQRIMDASDALEDLLAPLAQVHGRKGLEVLLSHIQPRYVRICGDVMQAVLSAGWNYQRTQEMAEPALSRMRSLAESRADLLGAEALEQLTGALDSMAGLQAWVAGVIGGLGEDPDAVLYKLSLLPGPAETHMAHAQMVIGTVHLILADRISEWLQESVPVLCSAADDYMTAVEDAFLSFSSLRESGHDSGDTVPLDEVRRKLAL
ncbi:MAG: hypothetical protein WD848_04285 [Dehalococcoidia bacterium]